MKRTSKIIGMAIMLMMVGNSIFAQSYTRRSSSSWRDASTEIARRDRDGRTLTIRLRRAGDLQRELSPEDRKVITSLRVEGNLNYNDFKVLCELAKRSSIIDRSGKSRTAYLDLDLEHTRYDDGRRVIDEIPDNAFYNGSYLRSVILPNRLRNIGNSAFESCRNLESVSVPDDLEHIGSRAFKQCTSLKDFYIPDLVNIIEDETFNGCSNLSSVSMHNDIRKIGNSAFQGTAIQDLRLPSQLEDISANAFRNSKMNYVFIPASVMHIDVSAFDTPVMKNYEVEEGNRVVAAIDGVLYSADGNKIFRYPRGRGGHYTIPNGVQEISDGAFRYSNIQGLVIPNSIHSIPESAFEECSNLASIKLPSSISIIPKEAFRGCKALREVTLPSSIRHLGTGCFRACKGMVAINLPEGLQTIGEDAFYYCESISTLTVPASVQSIGNKAFYHCSSMMQLTFTNPTPPAMTKINDNQKKLTVVVPAGSLSAYTNNGALKKHKNIVER